MRASLFLLGYATSFVSAGCFNNGVAWSADKFAALQAAQRLCEDGTLSGGYAPLQVKSACVNLSSLKKVNFYVRADGLPFDGIELPLKAGACTTRLHLEINGCDNGGESWHYIQDGNVNSGNLLFTSDPNEGQC
ncbi:hypothetical protein AK830_g2762 [Neonectria ditissima]|uniref:Cyanovirin-N domain-containing protein n=1 Tax=Neonectria ditissima TaxID=78410 RepID=A0A0N8H875_9HYPO|nr:hypothetical protein AK830_g2762 [Neonectria ditissima]